MSVAGASPFVVFVVFVSLNAAVTFFAFTVPPSVHAPSAFTVYPSGVVVSESMYPLPSKK